MLIKIEEDLVSDNLRRPRTALVTGSKPFDRLIKHVDLFSSVVLDHDGKLYNRNNVNKMKRDNWAMELLICIQQPNKGS